LADLIRDWGYIILFLYSFGGGFLALAVAGVLSFSGELNIYISLVVAVSANFIGDQFLFYMARTNKEFAKNILNSHKRKLAYSHLLMRKYGSFIILIKKYIYGVKTLVPLAIGLTKYSPIKFVIFNGLGAVLWGVVVAGLSYRFGGLIIQSAEEYQNIGTGIAIVVVALVFYLSTRK
jgi:membrane protein DedA with SNARE-associated domain